MLRFLTNFCVGTLVTVIAILVALVVAQCFSFFGSLIQTFVFGPITGVHGYESLWIANFFVGLFASGAIIRIVQLLERVGRHVLDRSEHREKPE